MAVSIRHAAIVVALLALMTAPALAVTMDSTLTGSLGVLALHAEGGWDGNLMLFAYSYRLTYVSASQNPAPVVHEFAVDNTEDLPFTSASNTDGFVNPTFAPSYYAVDWYAGNMTVGQTVSFGYTSIYGPTTINVKAIALNGGTIAEGDTIGMTQVIPEPASFAGLMTLLAASGGALLRARRRG